MIKRFVRFLSDKFFVTAAYIRLGRIAKGTDISFFDIDNTLADSRGTQRIKGVPHFPAMIEKVKEDLKTREVFFLTARNIRTWRDLSVWLKEKGIGRVGKRLILVSRPEVKLLILKQAVKKGLNVTFYDDLSYNHENGEILLYSEIITEVRKLPIHYIGIDEMKDINLKQQ